MASPQGPRSPDDLRNSARNSPWPWAIAGGLGLVVAVNIYVVRIASQDPPIAESEKPYEAGEAYESELTAWRQSAALGYASELSADAKGVALRVKDRAGAPVSGLSGQAAVSRNERRDRDQTLSFQETAPGVYEAKGDLGLAGVWRIKSALKGAQGEYLDDRRIWVQP